MKDFSSGLNRDDFKEEETVPVRREKLTMERIVRAISLAIFLRTVVWMWSRLQCELGAWECKSEICDMVAGVK